MKWQAGRTGENSLHRGENGGGGFQEGIELVVLKHQLQEGCWQAGAEVGRDDCHGKDK